MSAFGGDAVFREDLSEQLELFFFQQALISLGEVLPFRQQNAHYGIIGEVLLIHPHQLRKQLQVAPVAFAEISDAGLGAAGTQLCLQFGEARPALDVNFVDLKGAVQDFPFLRGIAVCRRR